MKTGLEIMKWVVLADLYQYGYHDNCYYADDYQDNLVKIDLESRYECLKMIAVIDHSFSFGIFNYIVLKVVCLSV